MFDYWGRYVLAATLAAFCVSGIAEETKSKRSSKSKKAVEEKVEDKLTGRLPRYFASLVDEDQRSEIYEIQAGYLEKISELEAELAELRAAQLKEIEEVLTSTQKKALDDLRSGDKKKASSSGKKSTSSRKTTSKSSSSKKTPKSSSSSKSKKKS